MTPPLAICPLCGGPGSKPPRLYRGVRSNKWFLEPDLFCAHTWLIVNYTSATESEEETALRWNAWCEEARSKLGLTKPEPPPPPKPG